MSNSPHPQRWYHGVSRYQWLVLVIASAGWIFDVYEGQIFNITRDDLLGELVVAESPAAKKAEVSRLGDVFIGIFLAGGMVGGLVFGMLGDRWGRKPTMIVTILMYSIFSGLTFFAQSLWQVAVLRFLVSMGIGGEWAVAAAMVAEVFPAHARAQASSIFHASSTLGTWMAGVAAIVVGTQWRYAYLIGVLPALLILWVRASIEEPEAWSKTEPDQSARKGSLGELFGDERWRGRAIAGVLLAAVGLATYWAITIAGQNIAKLFIERRGVEVTIDGRRESFVNRKLVLPDGSHTDDFSTLGEQEQRDKFLKEYDRLIGEPSKFAYAIVQATGGGIGLICFGPLCQWLGRRRAFILAHLLGVLIVPITCFVPQSYSQLLFFLPFYGAFTMAMHAGYAVYFPELFPARLRALGSSVCFNGGRIVSAAMMPLTGYVKGVLPLPIALTMLATTYLLGLVVIAFLPETKDQPLPE